MIYLGQRFGAISEAPIGHRVDDMVDSNRCAGMMLDGLAIIGQVLL